MKSLLLFLVLAQFPPGAWPPPGQVLGPDCDVTMSVTGELNYADGDKPKAMQEAYNDALGNGACRLSVIRKALATTHDYELTRIDEEVFFASDRHVMVKLKLLWHCK